jgi:protein O-mannosyl-transferase
VLIFAVDPDARLTAMPTSGNLDSFHVNSILASTPLFVSAADDFPSMRGAMNNSIRDRAVAAPAAGWLAFTVLAVVVGVVYGRAARAPFVHDDNISVLGNPSIVRLWPLFGSADHPGPFNPPRDAVTSGRPLVNLSLALNYYFEGYDTLGYHVVNAILHVLSATLLYGIVRRTLLLDRFRERFANVSTHLALAVAVVWAVHPLLSDAVEYVSQRTELMMGLFYLASLYSSLRYFTAETPSVRVASAAGATLACLAGMACKEVMVSAPVMTLLFDRTFVSGSFRAAFKRSWPLYVGLASGWMLLLVLNIDGPRSHAAGLRAGLPAYVWWFTQTKVVLLYLKLSIWPWPLVIHNETPILWTFSSSLPWLLPAILMSATTLILLWRRSAIGYLGAWFFAILAPTLIVPMPSEVVAERRMYLPLAAVVVLAIVGGFAALTRRNQTRDSIAELAVSRSAHLRRIIAASMVVSLIFCVVTSYRLRAYRDVITIWSDAVAQQPNNIRATINLGCALEDAGQHQEAIAQFERALEIDPTRPDVGLAHRSLGLAWAKLQQPENAIHHLELAMRLRPDVANDHGILGSLLMSVHRFPEAADQFEQAARQEPTDVLARANLATAYANTGRWSEAVATAQEARALALAQGQASWVAQVDSWLQAYRGRFTQH